MSESGKGQLLCSLAMVLVGSTVVVSKIIGQGVEPFLATALRHAAALPVFALLWWWQRTPLPVLDRHDRLLLLMQAAAGSVGYTVLLIMGVGWASAADAGVVAGTLPAMAGLFALLFLGERPGARLLGSLALATLGVMALAFAPPQAAELGKSTRLLGIVAVLGAVAYEALFILGNKRLRQPLPPLPMSTLMCAFGLLLSALPAWWRSAGQWPSLPTPALLGIVYYAWVPTVLGFWLWYAGSARTTGTRAALATLWLPLAALGLSVLLLGETVGRWQGAGLLCVLSALLLGAAPVPKRLRRGATRCPAVDRPGR